MRNICLVAWARPNLIRDLTHFHLSENYIHLSTSVLKFSALMPATICCYQIVDEFTGKLQIIYARFRQMLTYSHWNYVSVSQSYQIRRKGDSSSVHRSAHWCRYKNSKSHMIIFLIHCWVDFIPQLQVKLLIRKLRWHSLTLSFKRDTIECYTTNKQLIGIRLMIILNISSP